MSRALKLLLFSALCLALFFTVSTFRRAPRPSNDAFAQAQAASGGIAARVGQLAARSRLLQPTVTPPTPWRRPPLLAVINEVRRTEKGRQLYTRSGGANGDTSVPSGSYTMLTPNEMGMTVAAEDPERVAQGDLSTVSITYTYPRRVQWDEDVALCNARDGEHRRHGVFAVNCDSPGWYAISLHLENPTRYSHQVTNQLQKLLPGSVEDTSNDTRTVLPRQQYVVAGLVEVATPELYHFEWKASVGGASQSSHYLLLRAVTVDKL